MAKLIIKLINAVADVVNMTRDCAAGIKVVFLPNYRVSLAERIFPAADVSEQISTAGKEASGTGNMKFAHERRPHHRHARRRQHRDPRGGRRGELLPLRPHGGRGGGAAQSRATTRGSGTGTTAASRRPSTPSPAASSRPGSPALFRPVIDSLLNGGDPYLVLADFAAYCACQDEVEKAYDDAKTWNRDGHPRTSRRTGKFSSDRTIQQYADEIWKVVPVRPE